MSANLRRSSRVSAVAALAVLAIAEPLAADPKLWLGNGQSWDDPNAWFPPGTPGPSDAVFIPDGVLPCIVSGVDEWGTISCSGTLTIAGGNLTAALTAIDGTLNVSSGTFMPSTLQIAGTLAWTGGTILDSNGSFEIFVGGTATLSGGTKTLNRALSNHGTIEWSAGDLIGSGMLENASDGAFTLSGNGARSLGFQLVNHGSVVWNDNATLQLTGVPPFNAADGILTINGAPTLTGTGPQLLVNVGQLVKSGTGTATLAVGLVGDGSFDVQAGELRCERPADIGSGGSVNVAGSAKLRLIANTTIPESTWHTGATLTGTGTLLVYSPVRFDSDISFHEGTIDLNHTLAGPGNVFARLVWNSGTMLPGGFFEVPPLAAGSIAGNATRTLSRILRNREDIEWSENGTLVLQGGLLHNAQGAGLSIADSPTLLAMGPESPINDGALSKSFSGTATLAALLTGSGAFFVNGGELRCERGAQILSGGTVQVNSGATLRLAANPATLEFHLDNGATLTGTGTIEVQSPLAIDSEMTFPGTINLAHNLASDDLTIAGALTWAAGTIIGAIEIGPDATCSISGSGSKTLSATFNNHGDLNWSGDFTLMAGTFHNVPPDGSLTINVSPVMSAGFGQFLNGGQVTKIGATTATIHPPTLIGAGQVDVQAGTLSFGQTVTQTGGTTLLSGGGISTAQPFALNAGEIA